MDDIFGHAFVGTEIVAGEVLVDAVDFHVAVGEDAVLAGVPEEQGCLECLALDVAVSIWHRVMS